MFIREGTLSAISQHHPGAEGPDWSEARAFALAVTLRNFGERLVAACHLDTFAADVFVSTATDFVLLIETNPWGENTDPCLYDWHKEPPVDKALRLRRSGVIWRIPFERL